MTVFHQQNVQELRGNHKLTHTRLRSLLATRSLRLLFIDVVHHWWMNGSTPVSHELLDPITKLFYLLTQDHPSFDHIWLCCFLSHFSSTAAVPFWVPIWSMHVLLCIPMVHPGWWFGLLASRLNSRPAESEGSKIQIVMERCSCRIAMF